MNVLLWVLQVGLAMLYLAGGAYKTFKFAELASQMRALPPAGWRALGVLEMVGAVLLIVPAAAQWMPVLTPLAAAALALETLALAGLYARACPRTWSPALSTHSIRLMPRNMSRSPSRTTSRAGRAAGAAAPADEPNDSSSASSRLAVVRSRCCAACTAARSSASRRRAGSTGFNR